MSQKPVPQFNENNIPNSVRYGESRHDRLNTLKRAKPVASFEVTYPGFSQTVDVVEVPIDILKYRIDNGRTLSEQLDYIQKHKLDKDFFSKDFEDLEIQKAQHKVLSIHCTDNNIYKVFMRQAQREPYVVVEGNGYVLSGNRRVSVWRNLFHGGHRDNFGTIKVAFWNETDKKKLRRFELHEDTSVEIKREYSWVSAAMMYRTLINEFDFTVDEIEQNSIQDQKHVENWIERLELKEEMEQDINHTSGIDREISSSDFNNMKFGLDRFKDIKGQNKGADPIVMDHIASLCYPVLIQPKGRDANKILGDVKKFGVSKFFHELCKEFEIDNQQQLVDEVLKKDENWDRVVEIINETGMESSKSKRAEDKTQFGKKKLIEAWGRLDKAKTFFREPQVDQDWSKIKQKISQMEKQLALLKKHLKDIHNINV